MLDLTGITNENEFYTHHYLSAILEEDLKKLYKEWAKAEKEDGTRAPYSLLSGSSKKFFLLRNQFRNEKDSGKQAKLQREVTKLLLGPIKYIEQSEELVLPEGEMLPVFAKISPSVEDVKTLVKSLEPIVDGIAAINTVGPVLAIDAKTKKPLLGEPFGWLSGDPIKPIALRFVAEIANAVKIPVIGVGGISSGLDAAEHIMAGASAVQICTAALLKGPQTYERIDKELTSFMKTNDYETIDDFRGISLNQNDLGKVPRITERCTGCRICEKCCPTQAITIGKIDRVFKGTITKEKCTRCGLCMSVCPVGAILS